MKKTAAFFLTVLVTVLTLFFGSNTYLVDSVMEHAEVYSSNHADTMVTPDFIQVDEEDDEDDDDQEGLSDEIKKSSTN